MPMEGIGKGRERGGMEEEKEKRKKQRGRDKLLNCTVEILYNI